ncbi:hypothetical protein ACWCXX_40855 [Streptomyces sp. NPDC001732]
MEKIDDQETCAGGIPMIVRDRTPAVEAKPGEPLEAVFRRLVPEHRDLILAAEAEVQSKGVQ